MASMNALYFSIQKRYIKKHNKVDQTNKVDDIVPDIVAFHGISFISYMNHSAWGRKFYTLILNRWSGLSSKFTLIGPIWVACDIQGFQLFIVITKMEDVVLQWPEKAM